MTQLILTTGNEAVAHGAVKAKCDAYYGYPITPQNELPAAMARLMPELGRVFVQAESELAAVSMVFGSAVAGARAMTTSSSPGISLMQEGISYLAGCELPAVIVNVQRGGPGLGNIAPSQEDYFQATRGGGHGNYRTPVLAPHSAQEMFDFTRLAFDIADRYRTPVLVLSDGLIGQMKEPVDVDCPDPAIPAKPWALKGCEGRDPQRIRSLLLADGALEELNERLMAAYERMRQDEVRYEDVGTDTAELALVAYGTAARLCKEAVAEAEREGLARVGLLRPITLYPFPSDAVQRIADRGVPILVVEMSAGQMVDDVRLAVGQRSPVHFYGRMGGELPLPSQIVEQIRQIIDGRMPAQ